MSNVDELVEEVARVLYPDIFDITEKTPSHTAMKRGARAKAKTVVKTTLKKARHIRPENPQYQQTMSCEEMRQAWFDAILKQLED